MTNKSQRIYLDPLNPTDKHIKFKLEQNVDSFEFLSMKVNTDDVYQDFNADYGVLVGRVIANGGIGVPNARISIFIPLADEDEDNGDIRSVYPYRTPRDKNNEGKRYNLLPRVSRIDPQRGILTPKQPFGSFPIKEEIVTNETYLEVYKKYYKYTALTNTSGDYMIFGVPIGIQTVHLSVDITDIGEFSMDAASMINNLGYSPNLFSDDGTRIKSSNDLDDLPNIETQEISVDIIPFWGNETNFEIGITQQNFRVRSQLISTFTLFGSVFTDGANSVWGHDYVDSISAPTVRELYYLRPDEAVNVGISSKRIGKVTETIYYYPNSITDAQISSGFINGEAIDPQKHMLVLDTSLYSSYYRDGDFVFIVNCNRNKVITDNFGNTIPVEEDSTYGIFTTFRGFLTLELTPDDVELPPDGYIAAGSNTVNATRFKLKFPQYATRDNGFDVDNGVTSTNWRKQHYVFEKGKYYSLSKFHGIVKNLNDNYYRVNHTSIATSTGFVSGDIINNLPSVALDPYFSTGIIGNDSESNSNPVLTFPSNYSSTSSSVISKMFGANWMNLSIYLPQFGRLAVGNAFTYTMRASTNFRKQLNNNNTFNDYYFEDNTQGIAGGVINTKWYARSDLHWTDIIEVPLSDIQKMNNYSFKGFKDNQLEGGGLLSGKYRNGTYKPTDWPSACPISGGKTNGDPTKSADPRTYFYKGIGEADCIGFLYELGLVQ